MQNNSLMAQISSTLLSTVKEISGVKGYLYHDDAGYSYTFDKGNKEIVIQSNDEKLIPPVIA